MFVDASPTMEERRTARKSWKVIEQGGYRAYAREWSLPVSNIISVMKEAESGEVVVAPTLGGSVPMYVFEDLGLPWVGVPIVNYEQPSAQFNENLRLGHFWRGMEIYGAAAGGLNW